MGEIMPMKDWYHEVYLKSDYWKSLRLKTIAARDFKCEICGSESSLEIHHISYDHLGNELDSDLMCLCRNCHQIVHDLKEARLELYGNEHYEKMASKVVAEAIDPIREELTQKDAELVKAAYFKVGNLDGKDRSHLVSQINKACGQIASRWLTGSRVTISAPSRIEKYRYVHQRALYLISKQMKGNNK